MSTSSTPCPSKSFTIFSSFDDVLQYHRMDPLEMTTDELKMKEAIERGQSVQIEKEEQMENTLRADLKEVRLELLRMGDYLDAIRRELRTVAEERDAVKNEKLKMVDLLDTVSKEREALVNEKSKMESSRDSIRGELRKVIKQRDALMKANKRREKREEKREKKRNKSSGFSLFNSEFHCQVLPTPAPDTSPKPSTSYAPYQDPHLDPRNAQQMDDWRRASRGAFDLHLRQICSKLNGFPDVDSVIKYAHSHLVKPVAEPQLVSKIGPLVQILHDFNQTENSDNLKAWRAVKTAIKTEQIKQFSLGWISHKRKPSKRKNEDRKRKKLEEPEAEEEIADERGSLVPSFEQCEKMADVYLRDRLNRRR
ncbi:hypothetical protein L5515_015447 [Caenorhabditis briggsae]|uniref:Uncharacterized protein n=1 Tax=Caenorhabditis briggsae TaxID=6238 RepID=A0AAE9JA05_CAEBR|nr:hypothetical protein L5515_015447 [Caenorhabditis briggsae]